jgi:hypothetical protein
MKTLFRISILALAAALLPSFGNAQTAPGVTLAVGQKTIATLVPLEADGKTPSGATLSSVAWACGGTPFTGTSNADNTLTIAGLLVSNGAVSCTVGANTTDSDGLIQQFSLTFTVTVTPSGTPAARTKSIGISFTAPA